MSTSENLLSSARTVAPSRGWPEPSLLVGESTRMVMRTSEREWADGQEQQVAQVLLDKARREQVVMRATRTGPNV